MINFPKLKFSITTLWLLLVLITLVLVINVGFQAPLFSSIVFTILFILLCLFLKTIYIRIKYNKFLQSIGVAIDKEIFYEHENIMSLVPFDNKSIACSARIDNENLLFGRVQVYRSIKLSSIENIEFQDYSGHQIARITLVSTGIENQKNFYIPWSDFLENEVEVCEST